MTTTKTTPQHTPEPWESDRARILDNESEILGELLGRSTVLAQDYANAERVVACVNACAGIPNEDLSKYFGEKGRSYNVVIDDMRTAQAERDKFALLAEKLMKALSTYGSHPVLENEYKEILRKGSDIDTVFWQNAWNCKPYSGVRSGEKKFKVEQPGADHKLTNEGGSHE